MLFDVFKSQIYVNNKKCFTLKANHMFAHYLFYLTNCYWAYHFPDLQIIFVIIPVFFNIEIMHMDHLFFLEIDFVDIEAPITLDFFSPLTSSSLSSDQHLWIIFYGPLNSSQMQTQKQM